MRVSQAKRKLSALNATGAFASSVKCLTTKARAASKRRETCTRVGPTRWELILVLNVKRPSKKNQGCPHMSCTVCGYNWCWSCGQSYDSIVHRQPYINPILCMMAPTTTCRWILLFLIYILCIPLVPLLFFLIGFGYPFHLAKHISLGQSHWFINTLLKLLLLFGCLIVGPISGTISLVIFTIPYSVILTINLVKVVQWWCKSRERAYI